MSFRIGKRLTDELARDAAALEPGRDFGVMHAHHAVDEVIARNAQATFHLGLEAARFSVVPHFYGSVGGVLGQDSARWDPRLDIGYGGWIFAWGVGLPGYGS